MKQLYQFYGIDNIDEYIKEEEDTETDHSTIASENGDQDHADEQRGGDKAALDGDEKSFREGNDERCRSGEEPNRLKLSHAEDDEGTDRGDDFEVVVSSTPMHGTSAPQMPRPEVSPTVSPLNFPGSPSPVASAKRLHKRKVAEVSFTPLAVRRPRRKHH